MAAAITFGAGQLNRANQPTATATSTPPPAPAPADSTQARQVVMDVAKTSVVKLLSYTPENVDTTLNEAVALTTGEFRDSFTQLIRDVVIPGARQKNITAISTVPAVAVESLTADTAKLIVFIDQTVTTGSAEPELIPSSVRLRLENVNGAWLVATFTPL
ncbi:hypothetical protein ACTXG7_11930 [Mycolicibacterium sp. Dal123E01]|uniref:hypothetical protein n=1 Tax=Mycolicibacterium sp. Dal123E01 TaxID=3457578 RepID=UPI00403ED7BA